ncbi:MAG: hypothetical protein J7L45_00265 [Candidatus Aenigmarchaeota archaeon]|nr:hypothetical protein [Candidatus Aenigmarchaeota archaeon]
MSEDVIKLKNIGEGSWEIENHDQKRPLAKVKFEERNSDESDFELKKVSDGAYIIDRFDPRKPLAKYRW